MIGILWEWLINCTTYKLWSHRVREWRHPPDGKRKRPDAVTEKNKAGSVRVHAPEHRHGVVTATAGRCCATEKTDAYAWHSRGWDRTWAISPSQGGYGTWQQYCFSIKSQRRLSLWSSKGNIQTGNKILVRTWMLTFTVATAAPDHNKKSSLTWLLLFPQKHEVTQSWKSKNWKCSSRVLVIEK